MESSSISPHRKSISSSPKPSKRTAQNALQSSEESEPRDGLERQNTNLEGGFGSKLFAFGAAVVKKAVAFDRASGRVMDELGDAISDSSSPEEVGHRIKRATMQAVADKGAGFGLNPVRLIQLERVLYQATSSERDSRGKLVGPPKYMEELFKSGPPKVSSATIPNGPLQSDWVADILPRHDSKGAKTVLSAVISFLRRQEISDHLSGSLARWSGRTRSKESVREGTTTFISEQVKSMYPEGDQLPANLRSYARFVDMKSFCSELSPWLETKRPDVHGVLGKAFDRLTPNWNGGDGTFAHRVKPERVRRVYSDLQELSKRDSTKFADAVVGLEKSILSQEQSFWIKLLREGSVDNRSALLATLAATWADLSTSSSAQDGTEPKISKYRDSDRVVLHDTYNRADELGSVVEHTLKALSGSERESFRQTLLREIGTRKGAFQTQDAEVQKVMEKAGRLTGYPGLEIDKLADLKTTVPALSRLRLGSAGQNSVPPIIFPGQDSVSDKERQLVRRHLNVVNLLAFQEDRFAPRDAGVLASHPELGKQPIILGPYAGVRAITEEMATAKPRLKSGLTLGSGSQLEPNPVSIVLEGGGGKGFAYASSLRNLYQTLQGSPGKFKIDQFCGTSAGAITASLLAAGYSPDELAGIMERLPFSEFFSDHHQLTTGDDPQVGGVQRAGLFSTRAMEEKIQELLADKLGIHDRPVTFADLPYRLKVPSTVVASNAPPEVLEILQYSPETGRAVFSDETTPNMSVAAAASGSGAFPTVFHPPTMEITRPVEDENGDVKVERYWLQCSDGGLVDNFPLDLAGGPGEDMIGLVLPAHFSDGEEDGESLATLDFNAVRARALEKLHKGFFDQHGPGMAQFLTSALSSAPGKRAVFALDLREGAKDDRAAVLGTDPKETGRLHELSTENGFQVSSEEETRKLVAANTEKSAMAQRLIALTGMATESTTFLTEEGALKEWVSGQSGLKDRPVDSVIELVNQLVKTLKVASLYQEERRFEKTSP